MNCKKIRSRFTDYLMEDMDPDFLADLEKHIRSCPDCRAELNRLRSVWRELDAIPKSDPSPMLRSRFYAMLEHEKQRAAHPRAGSVWSSLDRWLTAWWPRRPVVQFAASFAVLLIGLWLGGQFAASPIQKSEMKQLRSEVRDMRQLMSLSLMNQPSSVKRIQGVSLTRKVSNPDADLLQALFETLQSDPNVNVRLAAVDALFLFRNHPGVRDRLSKSLTTQDSPLVQVALIDLLAGMREQKALDALKSLIQKEGIHPEVREYAEQKALEMS